MTFSEPDSLNASVISRAVTVLGALAGRTETGCRWTISFSDGDNIGMKAAAASQNAMINQGQRAVIFPRRSKNPLYSGSKSVSLFGNRSSRRCRPAPSTFFGHRTPRFYPAGVPAPVFAETPIGSVQPLANVCRWNRLSL